MAGLPATQCWIHHPAAESPGAPMPFHTSAGQTWEGSQRTPGSGTWVPHDPSPADPPLPPAFLSPTLCPQPHRVAFVAGCCPGQGEGGAHHTGFVSCPSSPWGCPQQGLHCTPRASALVKTHPQAILTVHPPLAPERSQMWPRGRSPFPVTPDLSAGPDSKGFLIKHVARDAWGLSGQPQLCLPEGLQP